MSCPCDQQIDLDQPLDITPGLGDLPRQIGGFPEFRRAMLAALREHAALDRWHARDEDDLGVMVLEMWAYVCDVLSFYDEAIANENYLRTAQRRESLRKLTGLFGYIPRPAVSASVLLVALAEGRRTLTLDAGTAFRSEAFGAEAPQVFELERQATLHPLHNSWTLASQRPDALGAGDATGGAHSFVLLRRENTKLRRRGVLLLSANSHTSVHTVSKRTEIAGDDGEHYIRLNLAPALTIGTATKVEDVAITTPAQWAGMWTMGASPIAVRNDETELIMDGLYRQLKAGQRILVSKGDEYRWFELSQVSDTMMDATSGGEFTAKNTDDDEVTLTIPAAQAPATMLTLDIGLNHSDRKQSGAADWDNDDIGQLAIHYAFVDVGELTRQRDTTFTNTSDLVLAPNKGTRLDAPVDGASPSEFVLQDVNQVSVQGNGNVNFSSGRLEFQAADWVQSLTPPVKVFGNVLRASRGETVHGEILGSGDPTESNQTFKLKKKPLTYIHAPTADDVRGVSTKLTVWVDGVKWREVATFFGQERDDEIYTVRQDDDQETFIIFGDGKRGRRLPAGTDNVVASYRYDAGAAAPPANSITQLAKPVKRLTAVNNPFAAAGGDDAEQAIGIRDYAPQSALLLGRAVSARDFIAATAVLSGVRAACSQWRWNNQKQRPVLQLWYIGESDSVKIRTTLRNLADPAVALDVSKATPVPLTLSFDVEVDDRFVEEEVVYEVQKALTDEESGMLAPANIGIGRPLYRSQLFAAILAVPGTITVTNMQHGETPAPFVTIAVKPNPGEYYDVASGALIINGMEIS